MPITVIEHIDSRELSYRDGAEVWTFHYKLTGTSDEGTARSRFLTATPSYYNLLRRTDYALSPEWLDTEADDGVWDIKVTYQQEEDAPPEPGDSSFNFDTAGGTMHLTQSLETRARYAPAGKTAPDYKGAIGVTSDGVEGVDLAVPVYTFSETHTKDDSKVDYPYRGKVFNCTGRTNNAVFKGLAIGECLFLGASGTRRGSGDWDITFRFAAQPNRSNLTVGDITVETKRGWDYLWVLYKEDTDGKRLIRVPVAAYVERVYEEASFADLEIGS